MNKQLEEHITDKESSTESDFFVQLTIDGTGYEEVEVKVSDPYKPIREQIQSIIRVFELPSADGSGCPIGYQLFQELEDKGEILEPEDEDGRKKSLMDYNVQSGDHLHLITVPAYACPIPEGMRKEWAQYCLHNE